MPIPSEYFSTGESRLWLAANGAGPAAQDVYEYVGAGRALGVDYGLGTIDPVRIPSASRYGDFVTIGTIRGAPDLPQVSIEQIKQVARSTMLKIANKQCAVDVQVHFGKCEEPSEYRGWELILQLEQAEPANFSTSDLGAIDPADQAMITETLQLSGQRIYEIAPIRPQEIAGTELTDEPVAVLICDSATCGQCGIASDGCQVAFIVGGATSGSPGLPAEVLYTQNGGQTWGTTQITTLGLGETPSGAACVGTTLVVISNDSNSLHYAPIADILAGTEEWTEVATGFAVGGEPNAIWSVGSGKTWIAGDGGYIYYSSDIQSGVEVVLAGGDLTSQDLTAVQALDALNVTVVGAANTVLNSVNGGTSWALITGPAPAVALRTVWMRSSDEWFVGTANGRLYYTIDGGIAWTEKGFPGSGAGVVYDVKFSSRNVGYMAHATATPAGRILRTTNGGQSWYVLPDERGQLIPDNDRVAHLAACVDDVNVVFGVGLAANGTDGFGVKFS